MATEKMKDLEEELVGARQQAVTSGGFEVFLGFGMLMELLDF